MMDDDIGEEILVACLGDEESVYSIIKRHREYVDWHDPVNRISILHSLVYNNATESCRILLSAGANPNCKNKVTPIQFET